MSLRKRIPYSLPGTRVLPTEPNRELSLRLEVGNSQKGGGGSFRSRAQLLQLAYQASQDLRGFRKGRQVGTLFSDLCGCWAHWDNYANKWRQTYDRSCFWSRLQIEFGHRFVQIVILIPYHSLQVSNKVFINRRAAIWLQICCHLMNLNAFLYIQQWLAIAIILTWFSDMFLISLACFLVELLYFNNYVLIHYHLK